MKETTITFIAQSPTPTQQQYSIKTYQTFDPGLATIWAALITAGLSSIGTIISLISNRRLIIRLERERQEHDVKLAKMQQDHEIQLENARLKPERRLQFIGYWRRRLRNDDFTYEDIFSDEAYTTLKGCVSLEVLQLIRQQVQKINHEKQHLRDDIEFEGKVLHGSSYDWDETGEDSQVCEDYRYHVYTTPEDYDEGERRLKKLQRQSEQFDLDLTRFIKDQLEEELRRLEKEEWGLL